MRATDGHMQQRGLFVCLSVRVGHTSELGEEKRTAEATETPFIYADTSLIRFVVFLCVGCNGIRTSILPVSKCCGFVIEEVVQSIYNKSNQWN